MSEGKNLAKGSDNTGQASASQDGHLSFWLSAYEHLPGANPAMREAAHAAIPLVDMVQDACDLPRKLHLASMAIVVGTVEGGIKQAVEELKKDPRGTVIRAGTGFAEGVAIGVTVPQVSMPLLLAGAAEINLKHTVGVLRSLPALAAVVQAHGDEAYAKARQAQEVVAKNCGGAGKDGIEMGVGCVAGYGIAKGAGVAIGKIKEIKGSAKAEPDLLTDLHKTAQEFQDTVMPIVNKLSELGHSQAPLKNNLETSEQHLAGKVENAEALAESPSTLEDSLIAPAEGKILTKEEFRQFREESGFKDGFHGTFRNQDGTAYLYIKNCHKSSSEAQALNNLKAAEHMTEKGILCPSTRWGVIKNGPNDYGLFAITKALQPYKGSRAELCGPEYSPNSPNISEDSLVMRWYMKLGGEESPLSNCLNPFEAAHRDNWGVDGKGNFYPIDVEVIEFDEFVGNRAKSVNEWISQSGKAQSDQAKISDQNL